jgi:hypothetical protein
MVFRFKVYFEYIGDSYFKIEISGVNTLEIDYSNIKFIDEDVNDEINGKSLNKTFFTNTKRQNKRDLT